MLTLFHAPKSRSSRIIWLLEELGAPYELKLVDIPRRDGQGGQDPANPHPDKKVPAIVHDGVLISESVAIVLYLTDAFPAAGIGPVVGDPLRGPYLSWLAYYAGVLEPTVTAHFEGRTAGNPQLAADYQALDDRLRTTLEASPYLLGENFSAADILFASLLLFARQGLPPHAVYDEWLGRLMARPAFARAGARDDG